MHIHEKLTIQSHALLHETQTALRLRAAYWNSRIIRFYKKMRNLICCCSYVVLALSYHVTAPWVPPFCMQGLYLVSLNLVHDIVYTFRSVVFATVCLFFIFYCFRNPDCSENNFPNKERWLFRQCAKKNLAFISIARNDILFLHCKCQPCNSLLGAKPINIGKTWFL